ncbi:MAG: sensor histidine kinase [Syntrophales bacterium]|nr:sensor histidine kinase [Syntrophales bacterium]
MEGNRQKPNLLRFLVIGSLLLACLGLEYWLHIVYGITNIYPHLFYIPVIVAALWWGLKGGLLTGVFLGLMHAASYYDNFQELVLLRSLMFVCVACVVGIIINRHKRAGEQIKKFLKEKEVLLQEIHHRVKNNMQVISSLLDLQSQYVKDKESLEIFKECRDRILSMASVHEKLYQSKDMVKIDFDDYIRSITKHLFRAYVVHPNTVRLNVNCSDVFLDINRAMPCGLIINELISNALKHAFPEGKKGEVTVDFHPDGDKRLTLVVSDNGVGFPEDIDISDTETFGLRLISILVNQLKGTLKIERDGGTTFKITFNQ